MLYNQERLCLCAINSSLPSFPGPGHCVATSRKLLQACQSNQMILRFVLLEDISTNRISMASVNKRKLLRRRANDMPEASRESWRCLSSCSWLIGKAKLRRIYCTFDCWNALQNPQEQRQHIQEWTMNVFWIFLACRLGCSVIIIIKKLCSLSLMTFTCWYPSCQAVSTQVPMYTLWPESQLSVAWRD